MFIQKLKQRYSNTNSLTSRINVNDISEDLKQSPPYEIKSSELMQTNGVTETKYKSSGTLYYYFICLQYEKYYTESSMCKLGMKCMEY